MKERYEHEIEQLLNELESEPAGPTDTPVPNDGATPLDDQPSPYTPKPKESVRLISANKLALAGLLLAVLGLLPFFPVWSSLAGLGIMVVAVVWMIFRRMGTQEPSYWRGRRVDEQPQGTWERFRHWLSR